MTAKDEPEHEPFVLYRRPAMLFLFHLVVFGLGFFAYAAWAQDRPLGTSAMIGVGFGILSALLGQAQLRWRHRGRRATVVRRR